MVMLSDIAKLESGPSQFRIRESSCVAATVYYLYGQAELEADLVGPEFGKKGARQIQTEEEISTLQSDDLVFSLISGKAAIVGSNHNGYVFTQNFARIVPDAMVSSPYLAYLLNENDDVKHQLAVSQQGSTAMRFTVRQLTSLCLPELPSIEVQEAVGGAYFSQLRLAALKKRQADLETTLMLGKLKEALCL